MSAVRLLDRGMEYESKGRMAEALECFDLSLRLDSSQGRAYFLKANTLVALQRFEDALVSYDRAIEIKPDSAGAHFNRGNVYEHLGRLEDAEQAIRTAVSLKPDFVDAWVGLGNVLRVMSRQDEALVCYFNALRLVPDYAEVHLNIALVCLALGKVEEAERHFVKCIRMKPSYEEAYTEFAKYLVGVQRADEAIVLLREALSASPGNRLLMLSLGQFLQGAGHYGESESMFRDVLTVVPTDIEAMNGLGVVLSKAGRHTEAEACFRKILQCCDSGYEILRNLAATLHAQRRYSEAISIYQQVLDNSPKDSVVLSNLALLRVEIGEIEEALDTYRKLERLSQNEEEMIDALSNTLFVRHYVNGGAVDKALQDEKRFGALVSRRAEPYCDWRCVCSTERVLRVGLVSADIRDHPVGFFVESVLEAFRQRRPIRLEFYVYSNTYEFDEGSARVSANCAGWSVIRGMSDAQVAERIHDDRIDILVDLSGHSAHNRLSMFAWKPAPVQVTWLGYFGTTGVSEIDYLIGDPWTIPVGEEDEFTETVWRLPETRLCFSAPNFDIAISKLPALENGFVTFGGFNNLSKLNADVVTVWSEILRKIPTGRLVLKCKQFDDPWVLQKTMERFYKYGVRPHQLLLEGMSLRKEYLERYADIDIVLDPFPYPGGTTTVEALWMGVPVLSMSGSRFLSRQGEGLLTNAGLADWVAMNPNDYVEKAVRFADDFAGLARIRSSLRDVVLASPLFDAPRFAGHLEGVLCEMWQRRCELRNGLS